MIAPTRRPANEERKILPHKYWAIAPPAPNPVMSTLRFFRNEYEELLQPDTYAQGGNGAEGAHAATAAN